MADINETETNKGPESQFEEAHQAIGIRQQELAMEGISGAAVDALRELANKLDSGTILPSEVGKVLGVSVGALESSNTTEQKHDEIEGARQAIGHMRYILAMEGISGAAVDDLRRLAKGLEEGTIPPEEVANRLHGEVVIPEIKLEHKAERKIEGRVGPEPAADEVKELLSGIFYRMTAAGAKPEDVDAVLDIFKALEKGLILPRVAKSRASEFGE